MNEKTLVITGGATGIGRAIVNSFANAGYRVIFGYNSSENEAIKLCKVQNDLGNDVFCYKCDVTKSAQVDKLINEAIKKFGRVDIAIANSGISAQRLITDISDDDFDKMIDVNLKGVFYLVRAAAKVMVSQHCGNIIAISSMWGQVGASMESDYSCSKAAVIGLIKSIAKELGPSGINANCICPGVIDTNMMKDFTKQDRQALIDETPLMRIGTPPDVAQTALFLDSDGGRFITGQVIGVNGGFVI